MTQVAEQLRSETIGCKVSFEWLGGRKTLSAEQNSSAANVFGADPEFLNSSKKLLNTKHPDFKAVTKIRGEIRKFWKLQTLPFTEPGIRLLRRDSVTEFQAQIDIYKRELENAVESLNCVYAELLQEAEARLGGLYNAADYPETLINQFSVEASFPSLAAPEYLAELSPALYQQECDRVRRQFESSVQLAEQAFAEELGELTERLREALSGETETGRAKQIRESHLSNFTDFVTRFRTLSIGSSASLQSIVDQAEQVVSGITANELRSSETARQELREQISNVADSLEQNVVAKPVRRLRLGNPAPVETAQTSAA